MRGAVVLVSCLIAGCMQGADGDAELPEPDSWPPPYGIGSRECIGASDGMPCVDEGWCKDCDLLIGCYCDGDRYECHQAESLCDFGHGAECAREGTPACNTPPAPAYCTCTATGVECEYTCPFPECPDYDPGTSSCTCADGTCP
jgi:hypothetical protein